MQCTRRIAPEAASARALASLYVHSWAVAGGAPIVGNPFMTTTKAQPGESGSLAKEATG